MSNFLPTEDGEYNGDEWVAYGEIAYLRKTLAHTLGSLIGATSILRAAHADNITPREVLPSDKMFFETLEDYENVIEQARKVLSK